MLKKILTLSFLLLLTVPLRAQQINEQITPSQGISFESIWRGLLGMIVLIFLAYLFSSNKKAIEWKTVGIGLALQLLIAYAPGFLGLLLEDLRTPQMARS